MRLLAKNAVIIAITALGSAPSTKRCYQACKGAIKHAEEKRKEKRKNFNPWLRTHPFSYLIYIFSLKPFCLE